MGFAYGEAVIVLRNVGTVDDYGDRVDNWTQVATEKGVGVWPRTSGDVNEQGLRDGQIVGLTAAFRRGVDIRGTDRIRVRGVDWKIVGVPADWSSPLTGWEPGVTVDLERVDG